MSTVIVVCINKLIGVTGAGNQADGDTVTFTPSQTGVYYYVCGNHSTMVGAINVYDPEVTYNLHSFNISHESNNNAYAFPVVMMLQMV